VRSFIRLLLVLGCSGNLLGVFAQDTTTRSGFAVVTLVAGNIAGLIGTETIRNQTGSGTEQAIASPAPLVTGASILVPVDPVAQNTTSVALANPSLGAGSVNLVLTDARGATVSNVVVTLQPRTQVSRFLSEFFGAQLAGSNNPLLLTISSEIPIGIGAFNFRDNDFTSVPLTSLSFATPVAVQTVAGVPVTTFQPVTTVQPITTIQPVTTVQPVQVVQTPIQVVQPVTATPPGPNPGFGLGLPTEPGAITTVTQPISVTGVPLPAPVTVTVPSTVSTTVAATTPVAVVPADVIGGAASLVFPQIVTGGGWSTELAIGNTSVGSQSVRIDFFGADGVVATSLTNVLIPPRGVVFFTVDLSVIGQ
jgi:hypothetical protein